MSLSTRIARLEVKAGKVAPEAPPDDDFDPSDLAQFLAAYFEMIETPELADYFAQVRQQEIDQITEYRRRIEAGRDYPGVEQSMGGVLQRYERRVAIQDTFREYMIAETTGIGIETALERFRAAIDMPDYSKGTWPYSWLFTLHSVPPPEIPGGEVARRRVSAFWGHFWDGQYGNLKTE